MRQSKGYIAALVRFTNRTQSVEADDPNPILTMRLNAKAIATMAITFRPCLMILLNRKDPGAKISNLVSDYAKRCIGVLEYSIKSSNLIKDDPLITHA
jgi:hypothetical protein